jgi:hypothetical protein
MTPYTVSRELGHGSLDMVERVYAHLGAIRHRSESVEYRIEQHAEALRGQFWGIPASSPGRCSSAALVAVSALQWLGFVVAGWVIGRLFPTHSLGLGSLAGMVLVVATILDPRLGTPEQMGCIWMCLFVARRHPKRFWKTAGVFG